MVKPVWIIEVTVVEVGWTNCQVNWNRNGSVKEVTEYWILIGALVGTV